MARVAIGADEKKKLYILGGLMAAIMVVVFVLYRPKPSATSSEESSATPAKPKPPTGGPSGTPAGGPPGAPGGAGGADSGGTGGSGAGSINAASLVSVSNFRSDPFEPFAKPIPTPTPPPPPPPPGPVVISPPSVFISQPGSDSFGGSLPPFGVSNTSPVFGGTPPSRILRELPPPYIPRLAVAPTAPNNFLPPGGGTSGGSNSRSPNKRLSGVIIGDSVRALLEISDGENTVTRIVQPGDEVDGIRILRVERTTEGGRPVTRMFIRENGEEHFVDLRPAPQQTGAGGGIPGAGAPAGGMRPPF